MKEEKKISDKEHRKYTRFIPVIKDLLFPLFAIIGPITII